MRKKKAMILTVLVIALIAVFAALNDPPIGAVSHDDVSSYMKINKFVNFKLETEFAATLPDSIPHDAKNAEYHYQYRCGLIGDASFYINLRIEYGSDRGRLKESERLQDLNPLQVLSKEGTMYLIFAGSEDAFDDYLDNLIHDGSLWHFNIVTIDKSTNTIEYSVAHYFDGNNKPERLTETILNVKNALSND